ncbi:MAG: murein biosynthesis integral membrane protein MurJ [Anaerolineales bacterium]|nr:murein biosynthesis integral membrane protein MurJ [Anaerolineales bacterium]
MDTSQGTANRQIARAAGLVMAAFALNNIVGLARQVIVLNAFGTSGEMDAFIAANRVSETLFTLVAGGALASAFIPTFTSLLVKDDDRGAWKLASAITNLILLILTLTALLAAILAPLIVRYILAPGFAANPAQEQLAVDLMRLMLPSAVLFGLSGLAIGILNSKQIFFLPALAPMMYQLGMIFGVLVLSPSLGIFGLAWGVLLGSALYLLIQLPALLRLGGQYFPILGLKLPAVREVGRLMVPRLLGLAFVQLNFWITIRLATGISQGSVTGVYFAFTLMLMPQALIAQSIAIAALPTFSAQFAQNKLNEMRSSLASSLRSVLLLSLPAAVGLIILRQPLVELIYQRGEFTARSTELVAWALLWFAVGLVGHSLVEIMVRAFYAMHDTKTPVLIGIAAMSLNIIFSLLFVDLFTSLDWMPHGGLALANSLATTLEMIVLLYIMSRRLHGLEGRRILIVFGKAALAVFIMAIVLVAWINQALHQPLWLLVVVGVALGAGVYGIMVLILGVKEARNLLSSARDLVRQKISA